MPPAPRTPVCALHTLPSLALALALIAGPTPTEAQVRGGPAKLTEAALVEYRELTERARKLGERPLQARDIPRFNRDMAAVRSELRRWAARHEVVLVEKTVVHPMPPEASRRHTVGKKAVGGQVTCDQDMVIDGTTCTLTGLQHDPGSDTYHCVYTCLDLDHPQDAAPLREEGR